VATLRLAIDAGDARKGARDFEQSAGRVTKSAGGAGRAVDGLKRNILALAGAYVSLQTVRVAVADARAFSRGIAEVNTIAKATAPQLARMREEITALSNAQGQSRQELSRGLYQTLSAGITDSADAMKVLAVGSDLALGGVTDVESAVDLLTSTLNAFGKSADEARDVADALFKTVELGKTEIPLLATSLARAAPIAANLGVSLEELLAMVADLTARGTPTAEALTQIRGAMNALLVNSEEIDELFRDKLGKGFDESVIKGQGVVRTLQDIREATGGDVVPLREVLKEVEAVTGALSLTEDGARSFNERFEQMADRLGASSEAADRMRESLDQKWQETVTKAKNALADFVGQPVLEGLVAVAELLERIGNAMPEAQLGLQVDPRTGLFTTPADRAATAPALPFNLAAQDFGAAGGAGLVSPLSGPPAPSAGARMLAQATGADVEGNLNRLVSKTRELADGMGEAGANAAEMGREFVEAVEKAAAGRARQREIDEELARLSVQSATSEAERVEATRRLLEIERQIAHERLVGLGATKDELAALDAAYGKLSTHAVAIKDVTESQLIDLDDVGKRATESLSTGLADAAIEGGKLVDVLGQVADALARMILQQSIEQTLGDFIPGGGGGAGAPGGLPSRLGNAFSGGRLMQFASGGVLNGPMLFPMNRGVGLAGEAGPEAILPLRRDAQGRLGVGAHGGGTNVVVNVQGVRNTTEFRLSERQIARSLKRKVEMS
jgi:TP901 family phage tail tape measure protein